MNGVNVISELKIKDVPDATLKIAGVGDFNGDGSPEILWKNSVTGEVVEWSMSGAAARNLPLIAALPLSSSIECIGDASGDKGPDVVWLYIETLSTLHLPINVCLHLRSDIYSIRVRAPPTFQIYS